MNKLLTVLIIGWVFLTSVAFGQTDFRQTKWGMSQAEVKLAVNGEPHLSEKDILSWKTELLGEQAFVVYTFAFNKLIRAKYMFATLNPTYESILNSSKPRTCDSLLSHPFVGSTVVKPLPDCDSMTSNGQFILDFEMFEEALTKKYGKPYEDFRGAPKEAHLDSATTEEKNNAMDLIEKAIRFGKLAWYSKWKTKDTEILLILHGPNQMHFEIGYSSLALKYLGKEPPL